MFTDVFDLYRLHEDIWRGLCGAPKAESCGWRLPILGTTAEDHCFQRIVVLRDVDSTGKRVLAHTDIRSQKVGQLRNRPLASWLFWDPRWQVQLQLSAHVTIHTDDDLADHLWDSQPESSLRAYCGTRSPGERAESPETNVPADLVGRVPLRSRLSQARDHFAVLCGHVQRAETVVLRREGNLRAEFSYDEDGTLTDAAWLVP